MIDIFKKYTPGEVCQIIGCDMKILLPILKKMAKKKRCTVKEKGESYTILGGEVNVIKYGLENTHTYDISEGKVKVIK